MTKLLPLILLLASCSTPYVRMGTGTSIGRHVINIRHASYSGHDISTTNFEIGIFQPVKIIDELYSDWGAEITSYRVGSDDSYGISGDLNLRLRYDTGVLEPYIFAQHGIGSWSPKFDGQGSHWGFPTSFGAGNRFQLWENKWLFLEYRVFHESNGAGTFLKSPEPNPGFNTDMIFVGVEFEF